MKKCTNCNKNKELNQYYDNRRKQCKECLREIALNRYNKLKDIPIVINENKKCYVCNIEKNLSYFTKHRNICKICNYNKLSSYNKNYILKNKEYYKNYTKEYYKNLDKEKIKDYHKKYVMNRYNNEPLFKLKNLISNSIRKSLISSGIKKNTKTVNILGCSIEDFKIYLESKFEDWMNWSNHGLYSNELNFGWDIDHIIPTSSAKNEEEIFKLNHYTNLQPLCSKTNRDIKKAKNSYEK